MILATVCVRLRVCETNQSSEKWSSGSWARADDSALPLGSSDTSPEGAPGGLVARRPQSWPPACPCAGWFPPPRSKAGGRAWDTGARRAVIRRPLWTGRGASARADEGTSQHKACTDDAPSVHHARRVVTQRPHQQRVPTLAACPSPGLQVGSTGTGSLPPWPTRKRGEPRGRHHDQGDHPCCRC